MRCGIILAAALTAASATAAQAQPSWCGYAAQAHAIVQCGYSSLEGCENAIGKGGMCFVNPYLVLNTKRAAPMIATKLPAAKG